MKNKPEETIKLSVKYVGICGSDIQKLQQDPKLNINSLGHELVCEYKGKPVVVNPMRGCEVCDHCREGKVRFCTQLKAVGRNTPGGLSGSVEVAKKQIYPIFFELPKLGVFADPYAVVTKGLKDLKPQKSGKVLIIGDGAIAILCLVYIMIHWSQETIQLSFLVKNSERAGQLRAVYSSVFKSLNSTVSVEFITDIKDAAFSADLALETVGRGQDATIGLAVRNVKYGGTILSFGVYPENYLMSLDVRTLLYKEVKLFGSNSYEKEDICAAIDDIAVHEEIFKHLLGQEYADYDVKKAINNAKSAKRLSYQKQYVRFD